MHHNITATQTQKSRTGGYRNSYRDTPNPPQWPSYTGESQFVATSPSGRVTVYVDPSLGRRARQNAQDLVNDADRVLAANDSIFGTVGGAVNVIIFALGGATDGTGGADHMGCDYVTGNNIEVCASFGNSSRVSALFEAELSECSMNGNLCGLSTGEALSRWCAAEIGKHALDDFASAPEWASANMPDFVATTDPTDRNPLSTGCGMAFISWLLSLQFGLDQIAPAMVSLGDSGTLAQLYAKLTGRPASGALRAFMDAVEALPDGVNDDDPFGGVHTAQLNSIPPSTFATAGEVFAGILTDIAEGRPADQIVAKVRAALSTASGSQAAAPNGACCKGKSRRLVPPNKA